MIVITEQYEYAVLDMTYCTLTPDSKYSKLLTVDFNHNIVPTVDNN